MTQRRDLPFRTSRSGFPARGAGARVRGGKGPWASWPFGSVSFPVASGLTELKHSLLGGTEGRSPGRLPLVSITPGEVCAETTRNPDLGRDPRALRAQGFCVLEGPGRNGPDSSRMAAAVRVKVGRLRLPQRNATGWAAHPPDFIDLSQSGGWKSKIEGRPMSIQARVLSPACERPPSYRVLTC